jgi:hypothetical protein
MKFLIILGLLIGFLWASVSAQAERGVLNQSNASTKALATHRSKLPENIRKLLPKKGLVFLSGGFMSSARRIVVNLETGDLKYAIGETGVSSLDLKNEKILLLTPDEKVKLVRLADSIWSSSRSFMRDKPIADFDVRLILCDDEWVKDIQSYGPPIGKVEQLYTLTWSLVPN